MSAQKKWISSSIKKPGRLTRAAKRAGVSTKAMARRWAKSPDKSKRGAGILGLRFQGALPLKKKGGSKSRKK